MNPRCPPAVAVLLLAALVMLGCRDEPTFPTDPTSPPQASLATTAALAFWQVSGGYGFTCAITTDNAAWCWGDNLSGQLGAENGLALRDCIGAAGPFACSTKPVRVAAGDRTFRQIAAGYNHTCGVTTDFQAWCWGSNQAGELGAGTTTDWSPVPVAVAGDIGFDSSTLVPSTPAASPIRTTGCSAWGGRHSCLAT
jgi:hypothetical protein